MFELHITCSKDFERLNIEFSDGSITEVKSSETTQKNNAKIAQKPESFQTRQDPRFIERKSTESCTTRESKDPIDPLELEIPDVANRPNKIVKELENFNF